MKKLNLQVWHYHTLAQVLETKEQGFTIGKLRQLNNILDKFEEHYQPFREEMQKIFDIKDGAIRQEKFNELKGGEGKKQVEVELSDEEFTLLKELWNSADSFAGYREARKTILEIDEEISK
jgi:flagellar motor switch protein FliM